MYKAVLPLQMGKAYESVAHGLLHDLYDLWAKKKKEIPTSLDPNVQFFFT